MCYYNGIKIIHSEYIRLKELEKAVAQYGFLTRPLLIGFDYGYAPVLKKTAHDDFDIVEMEWGFLPAYISSREAATRMRVGYKKEDGQFQPPMVTLNAVGEELLFPRKIYREAALHNRCLVLSTGFFEWRHVFPQNKKTGKPLKTAVKYPYHIQVKEQDYFFMAGIWTPWQDRETGEYAETFAVVTTAANGLMEQVHNSKKRMPLILTEALAWEWLMDDLPESRINEIARYQFPAIQMEACSIAKNFREEPEPSLPIEYAGLPGLVF